MALKCSYKIVGTDKKITGKKSKEMVQIETSSELVILIHGVCFQTLSNT